MTLVVRITITVFILYTSGCVTSGQEAGLDLTGEASVQRDDSRPLDTQRDSMTTPTQGLPTLQPRAIPSANEPPSSDYNLGQVSPPSSGVAQSDLSGTDILLHDMFISYKAFMYEDVVQQGMRLFTHPEATLKQKVTAYILAGAASYLVSKPEQAVWYFQQAHTLWPGMKPNPDMFPEAVLWVFNNAGFIVDDNNLMGGN